MSTSEKSLAAAGNLQMTNIKSRLAAAVFTFGVFCGSGAYAETVQLTASLNGASDVPPSDSSATGQGRFKYDTVTHELESTVTYDDLSGPATAAHIHGPASDDKIGGAVTPFYAPGSPIAGQQTLSDSQAADLLSGKYYVDVHSDKYPTGEIRGKIHQ
jgi:hypothetical protein